VQRSPEPGTPVRRGRLIAATSCLALACLGPAPAHASIKIAGDAHNASLQVDAAGNAVVNWTATDGSRHSLLVLRDGSVRYGGTLSGGDVSRATTEVTLPWVVAVRRTPDGSFYALQSWRRLATGPVELRFSRWRGAATSLTLRAVCCKWGSENIEGSASFHGRPVYGSKVTPQGAPLDPYGRNVYLDAYRGGHWVRMMGILTHRPTGLFSLWIRPAWAGSAYQGTISGPNWGWTLAPDAEARTPSSRS
jgi:hypothetical protein